MLGKCVSTSVGLHRMPADPDMASELGRKDHRLTRAPKHDKTRTQGHQATNARLPNIKMYCWR